MLLKGGYYFDSLKKSNRDIPPKGHILFVLSSGHSKPITVPYIETIHPPRQDYQLIYVHHGAIRYFDKDGTEHIAPEGSFLLYKPLEYQKYILYLKENAEIYWCHFSGTFAEILLKNYNIYDKKIITLSSKTKYRRLYTSLRTTLENKPKYFVELCSLYLQELIVTIGSDMESNLIQNSMPIALKNAVEYIHEYYYENITIAVLVKIAASNKITLTKQFEKYLQCSPKKYLNKFRIEKAKTLLLQTEYKIKEIASAVGYQDPLYFSTVFHEETSFSPREFRNQNK